MRGLVGGRVRIFGVILAGGQGRRLGGRDKAMQPLAGVPLIRRAIERAEPQVERLAISANGDAARFASFGLPVLPDATPLGPLAGVLAALEWATPLGATAVVSFAVDTPFFPGDLVPRLCLAAESSDHGVAIAHSAKDHPTFALWPVHLAADLAAFLASGENPRVMRFVESHAGARACFPDDVAFSNLNTAHDFAKAEAELGGRG